MEYSTDIKSREREKHLVSEALDNKKNSWINKNVDIKFSEHYLSLE